MGIRIVDCMGTAVGIDLPIAPPSPGRPYPPTVIGNWRSIQGFIGPIGII